MPLNRSNLFEMYGAVNYIALAVKSQDSLVIEALRILNDHIKHELNTYGIKQEPIGLDYRARGVSAEINNPPADNK